MLGQLKREFRKWNRCIAENPWGPGRVASPKAVSGLELGQQHPSGALGAPLDLVLVGYGDHPSLHAALTARAGAGSERQVSGFPETEGAGLLCCGSWGQGSFIDKSLSHGGQWSACLAPDLVDCLGSV